jgi:hypothetical protein
MTSGKHGARLDCWRLLPALSACAVCLGLLGCGRGESIRRPVPGDRIVAENASGAKWVAGQINDTLIRYRFADTKNGSTFFHASLLTPETLPRLRIEYVRGTEASVAEGEIAWCKRFC